MEKWQEVVIGNHIDLVSGYAFKSGDFLENKVDGALPVIKIKNVANGDVNFNYVVYHKFDSSLEKFVLSKGDVLIAMTGNHPHAETQVVGDVSKYKLPEKALLNQRVGKLVPKGKTDLNFIYYLFKSEDVRFNLANKSSGSANQANISKGDILGLEVKLPNPTEQATISSILTSIDDKIDLLHRQNTTLEKMAETLFRQWFVEETKEDWPTGKVSDLIKILSGFAFKSSSFVESGKYRLITIKGVQDGYLELNNADRIEELPDRLPEFCKLEIGDILLSLTGNVGRCCLVDTKDLLLNQRVAKLEPIKERDRAYTYFLFRQPQIKQLLEEMGKGTAQSNLSPIETSNMELIIPNEYYLEQFSMIATPLLNKLLFNKKSIQTLTQLRDSLLHKLMNGEVSVDIK